MSSMKHKRRPFPKGPLIAVAVVAVVTLLALLGVLGARAIWAEDPEPDPAVSDPTPPAVSDPAPDDEKDEPFIRDELKVTAGEGGSGKSKTDPGMPVGYEPTCKGAVEAATNYLVGMDITRVTAGEISREDYLSMVKDRTAGSYRQKAIESTERYFNALDQADSDQEIPAIDVRPEWGGFHVYECTEGETATIEIISASDFTPGQYSYVATSTELEWIDGDWKEVGGGTEVQSPTTFPEEPVSEPDATVLRDIGFQTQWENYVNAPK